MRKVGIYLVLASALTYAFTLSPRTDRFDLGLLCFAWFLAGEILGEWLRPRM